jgi:citrate lyase subunit beta/citryl-CoA lyase
MAEAGRHRMCRSHLFAPGNNERLLAKVFDAGADAVVLDLEDAVAPDVKAVARAMVAGVLPTRVGPSGPLVAVRINGIDTDWWREDLAAVIMPGLQIIRIPKAESAEQLQQASAVIDELELARGMAVGAIGLVATIESAAGALAAAAMARVPRLRSFAFGATDFVRDIGADPAAADLATLYARQHLVLASRAAGIQPPIASVHTQVKDLDALRRSTDEARAIGFFGRSCIHPSQVPIVNDVFTPGPAQVLAARTMIAAWLDATARGVAAFAMPDGQFVDGAVIRRARAVVELADALEKGPIDGAAQP